MSTSHKAFVSSTFEDLKEHRAYVIKALRDAGIHVDPMENWTAATVHSQQGTEVSAAVSHRAKIAGRTGPGRGGPIAGQNGVVC